MRSGSGGCRPTRRVALGGALAAAATSGWGPRLAAAASAPIGVFATADDLARARRRRRALADFLAGAASRSAAAPFVMEDMAALRFPPRDHRAADASDTLHVANQSLTDATAVMRDQALAFALAGSRRLGAAALAAMRDWARRHTAVNLYDFAPDFRTARHAGDESQGWHFALNLMWQSYGLTNAADAWLSLRSGGLAVAPAEAAVVEAWLGRLCAAVDSGLHAWTRWADANPHASAHAQYRTTNHLTWAQVGLLAGAAARGDDALAHYVLAGNLWDNGRAGPYANPSPLPVVIDRAVENGGRLFEERIGRTPLIGYALFHLEAMSLAARIAALHFNVDLWRRRGPDGVGMLDAFRRYAPYLSGLATSPDPAEPVVAARWLFALSPAGYGGADRARLLATRALDTQMTHVLGPAALLYAP